MVCGKTLINLFYVHFHLYLTGRHLKLKLLGQFFSCRTSNEGHYKLMVAILVSMLQ